MQLGFRIADGISERVVFREFFPIGLTALDDFDEHVLGTKPTLSHLAARQEIRQLLAALRLPTDELGRKRVEARRKYAEVDRPADRHAGYLRELKTRPQAGWHSVLQASKSRHILIAMNERWAFVRARWKASIDLPDSESEWAS